MMCSSQVGRKIETAGFHGNNKIIMYSCQLPATIVADTDDV